jgi:hypothetical protein
VGIAARFEPPIPAAISAGSGRILLATLHISHTKRRLRKIKL